MTYIEMLIFNREPIKRLVAMGFKPDDCHYIDMYKDYVDMQVGGGKKTWTVAKLSEKYHISERKVYSLIKRFEKRCKMGAV